MTRGRHSIRLGGTPPPPSPGNGVKAGVLAVCLGAVAVAVLLVVLL